MTKALAVCCFFVVWIPVLFVTNALTEGSNVATGIGEIASIVLALGMAGSFYRMTLIARAKKTLGGSRGFEVLPPR